MSIADRYQDYQEKDKELEIEKIYSNWEEKKMEREKNITTKQAVKALGRNFLKWVKEHKVEIATAAIGTAIVGAVWKASADVVNSPVDTGLMNTLDAIDALEKSKAETDIIREKPQNPLTYFNTQNNAATNNCYTTFIMEPADRSREMEVTPDQLNDILSTIHSDYERDYALLPTVNNELKTIIYDDGSQKVISN